MFIPRGKLVQDNLATSYVLLEPLVEDLQQGGFSGLVEIVLRETDNYIIFDGGNVTGMLEKRVEVYDHTNLADLASSSRLERGRVAIYAYSPATASIVSGRIKAQTLYEGLSTEFTDAEKMILKLARETEREWFVEVNTPGGLRALIHLSERQCRVIGSREGADVEEAEVADLSSNETLAEVLRECSRAGGTLNVCFTVADDAPAPVNPQVAFEAFAAASVSTPLKTWTLEDPGETAAGSPETATEEQDFSHGLDSAIDSIENSQAFDATNNAPGEVVEPDVETEAPVEPGKPDFAVDASKSFEPEESTLTSLADELKTLGTGDLILNVEETDGGVEVEARAETKRLMGEIAGVIEEAAQSVGPHDSFLMSLRGGQIKVADRYPFLDPFAGEFEYLAGEIVFVGQATAEEFVAGFSEALTLAVQSVLLSTAYPERFRSYVAEDLKKLLARNQTEYENFGLDILIEHLINSVIHVS